MLRELYEILASPHFNNSKRYPALLEYVVKSTLDGKSELLKERTLGVEVFDRPPTYDTNADPVVRYTAGEVRKRLSLYYSEQKKHTSIRISLPAGSYIPKFCQEPLEAEEGVSGIGNAGPHSGENAGPEAHSGEHPAPHGANRHEEGGKGADSSEAGPRVLKLLKWLAIAALLGAFFAAGFWWRDRAVRPLTAVDEFWEPLLHNQHTVVLCTGSVVFAQNNYSGVQTASKNIDYPFVSLQNASAIAQVVVAIERGGVETKLVPAASTPLTELREHSVALVGAYNNQWSVRLLEPMRFHFSFSPDSPDYMVPNQNPAIVDRTQPQTHWERDAALPYSSADDYALVARFRNSSTDGWVVVVAGLGRNGTEAAALFATDPHYLDQLRERIGENFANHNIEVVLKVNVIDGKTGAPSIMAAHVW